MATNLKYITLPQGWECLSEDQIASLHLDRLAKLDAQWQSIPERQNTDADGLDDREIAWQHYATAEREMIEWAIVRMVYSKHRSEETNLRLGREATQRRIGLLGEKYSYLANGMHN